MKADQRMPKHAIRQRAAQQPSEQLTTLGSAPGARAIQGLIALGMTLGVVLLTGLLSAFLMSHSTAQAQDRSQRESPRVWPHVALPPSAQGAALGDDITVSGVPMRVQAFVSSASVDALSAWFARTSASPWVTSMVNGKLVMGQARGLFYITVELQRGFTSSGGAASHGVVAATDLQTGFQRRREHDDATRQWLSQLPASTRILSHTTSNDSGRHSLHLVASNFQGLEFNRDRITALLHDRGLSPARRAPDNLPSAGGRSLLFQGRGKEAMVVLAPAEEGRTVIVLNLVTSLASHP